MYPDADIPVLQMSLPTLDPRRLMDIGRKLAPLRDEGVLIVGSGFFTHNLAALRQGGTPSWSAEFDDWGRAALDGGDIDTLLDFRHAAPAAPLPTPAPNTSPPLRHPRRRRRHRRPRHPAQHHRRLLDGAREAIGAVRLGPHMRPV